MTRAHFAVWFIVLGCSTFGVALHAPSATRARHRMDLELARLAATRAQAEEVARLRSQSPEWALRRPRSEGLATRITEAISASGLSASCLSSLSPATEVDAAGGSSLGAKRRRAVLILTGVSLPQVGGFLATWRELEPDWIVAGIELKQDHSHRPPVSGGDVALRANITLEALYVGSGGENRK